MNGREKFNRYKKIINIISNFFNLFSKKRQSKFFASFSKGESTLKLVFRYAILKNICRNCGNNVFIGENVTIKHVENLSIGDNVSIHKNCYIDALGDIEIGNNVSIATDCKIISFNHTYSDATIPIKYNPLKAEKIKIYDDVWIGTNSVLLANVEIKKRVIIAAGSVVTKSIEPNSICAGVPAKIIKKID